MMSNSIHFSDKGHRPIPPLTDRAFWDEYARDKLSMTNRGTAMFINIICLSGGRLAETDTQKRMMVFLAEQNQDAVGSGTVGFDIDEMPWDREHFAEDKAFMLRVIEGARQRLGWETLDYTPNAEFAMSYLDDFQVLIERMTEADIRDELLAEWLAWHDPEDPPFCGYPLCSVHHAYLSLYGCQVCMD